MKTKFPRTLAFVVLVLPLPATADTYYSGFQNIQIPTTLKGVYVDVNDGHAPSDVSFTGWDINPYFGGVAVANSSAFQPARDVAGNLGTLLNLAPGITTVSASNVNLHFGTGSGISADHMDVGGTFTATIEGYLGFKLGANYGWMRVVFNGDDTSNAYIKDWAYDTSGSIVVGRIQQSAAVARAQTVTLSPGIGESFTLASAITDSSGNTNSVVKNGEGTTVLSGTNTYSGTTTVSAGTLTLGSAGSIANSSKILAGSTDASGAVLDVSGVTGGFTLGGTQALGGTGTITGAVTISAGGILSPGASIESLTMDAVSMANGSIFEYEYNATFDAGIAADLLTVKGNLDLGGIGGTVTLDLKDLGSTSFAENTTLSLIQYTGTLEGGFFTGLAEGGEVTLGGNTWYIHYGADSGGLNFASETIEGSHFITLSNFSAIPEPGSMLALGCLVGSGMMLRRRRNCGGAL